MRWLAIAAWLGASAALADQTAAWLDALEHPESERAQLTPKNQIEKYRSKDLTAVLMPRTEFLGYIGDGYRRLRMTFKSIERTSTPNVYRVSGTTRVDANTNTFDGTIAITQIRKFAKMHYGCDDEFKDAGFKAQGVAIGSYTFTETPTQPHSGIFEGIVTAYWLEDRDGNVRYDDIEASYSDSYINNQYVGTWRPHSANGKKTANWGEHRIPFSGDLDIGAGEFGADPKYALQGWDD